MARAAPDRSRRPARSPANDALARAWDTLKATLADYRSQEAADKIRRDLTVIVVEVEREAAQWIGKAESMPDDWVFKILQEEEAGEYEMRMPK